MQIEMGNQPWFVAWFVVKLFSLSGLIALAIKYLLPMLNLPATTAVALGLVLTPPLVMAGLLAWRQLTLKQLD
jgi:hypothetical protein